MDKTYLGGLLNCLHQSVYITPLNQVFLIRIRKLVTIH